METASLHTHHQRPFPRIDVAYCYICNTKLEVHRIAGDFERYREKNAQYCFDNFVEPTHLNITPFLCDSPACDQAYKELPSARYPEERVVYRPEVSFDGGSFLEFPKRLNRPEIDYDPEASLTGTTIRMNYLYGNGHNLEPLLQAWLFFGLGHEVLGKSFQHQDYLVEDNNGVKYVILSPLGGAIERWMPTVTRVGEEAHARFSRFFQCLKLTITVLLDTKISNFDDDLRVFIASAAELIGHALQGLYPTGFGFSTLPFRACWPQSRLRHLVDIGWCPYEAYSLQLSALAPYALCSNLDRRRFRPNHLECSAKECNLSRPAEVDASGAQHRATCNEREFCKQILVNENQMDAMIASLKAGQFPLLRVRVDEQRIAQSFEVVSFQPGLKYVAISHVWLQGLGNEIENGVFRCQLTYLSRLIDKLHRITTQDGLDKEMFLWLDTLCCPVLRRCGPGIKKLALMCMANIYRSASLVLALDTEWQHLTLTAISPLDLAIHVFHASWNWRLWTFQEGSICSELWVQVGDQPVNVDTLFLALRSIYRGLNIRDRITARDLFSPCLGLRVLSGKYTGSEHRNVSLQSIMRTVQRRRVKHWMDEPLCITTLLGLNPATILEAENPMSRMQNLWLLMSNAGMIPRSIPFSTVNTLDNKGYSWAHSTFLQPNAAACFSDRTPERATVADGGLLINGAGISIKSVPRLTGFDQLYFDESRLTKDEPVVTTDTAIDAERIPVAENYLHVLGESCWGHVLDSDILGGHARPSTRKILQESGKEFALVFKHLRVHDGTYIDSGECILVELKERNDGAIVCVKRGLVTFKLMVATEKSTWFFARVQAEHLKDRDDVKKHQKNFDLLGVSAEPSEKRLEDSLVLNYTDFCFDHTVASSIEISPDIPKIDIESVAELTHQTLFPEWVKRILEGYSTSSIETFSESQMWCLQ